MIISIRNQFKQSTFRYIALFIVVAIALGMVSVPTMMKQQGSTWALKVNGEQVSYREFAQEVAEQSEFLAQVRAQYGQYADLLFQAMGWPTDPKFLAYEMLIKLSLMDQLVKKLGIVISDKYIAESINNAQFIRKNLQRIVPAFIFNESGSIDAEKLTLYLKHKGLSHNDFEYKIEQSLAQLQAVQFIASSCYVPRFDSNQEFVSQKLGKQFSYLTFSFDTFLAAEKNKEVTDEEALSFYEKQNIQRRRYYVPEKRDGVVYKFTAQDYAVEISQEDINAYYEDNKVSKYVLDPIKVHVRQLSEKSLPAHTSIESVYAELVNNPAGASIFEWKSIEPFARTEKKGKFVQEAFLLQNEGDISSIIDVDGEKVILQLVQRIARTYKPLSSVRDEITKILAEKHFKKNFVKDLKEIATRGDVAIEEFIQRKRAKKELVVGVAQNDTKLSQELFSLKKGEYSFYIDNQSGYAVVLTTITDRHLPAFDTIKDIVKNDVREEKAYDAMEQALEKAYKDSKDRSFSEISQKYALSLSTTDIIKADDSKAIQELDKKGLPTRIIMNMDKKGLVFKFHDDKKAYLIKIDAFEEYSPEALEKGEKEVRASLLSHRLKGHIEGVVASLHRNATIETNESIIIASEEYSE